MFARARACSYVASTFGHAARTFTAYSEPTDRHHCCSFVSINPSVHPIYSSSIEPFRAIPGIHTRGLASYRIALKTCGRQAEVENQHGEMGKHTAGRNDEKKKKKKKNCHPSEPAVRCTDRYRKESSLPQFQCPLPAARSALLCPVQFQCKCLWSWKMWEK
ncbi:uncharacterized protein IWZ02DRAFT_89367 [Phyllosticta citriasiana]|uniref:uncharacterized protein n=1 Tax=Phyllosticta citriasiana TaxID=595635 RepID=UPI0030FDB9E3